MVSRLRASASAVLMATVRATVSFCRISSRTTSLISSSGSCQVMAASGSWAIVVPTRAASTACTRSSIRPRSSVRIASCHRCNRTGRSARFSWRRLVPSRTMMSPGRKWTWSLPWSSLYGADFGEHNGQPVVGRRNVDQDHVDVVDRVRLAGEFEPAVEVTLQDPTKVGLVVRLRGRGVRDRHPRAVDAEHDVAAVLAGHQASAVLHEVRSRLGVPVEGVWLSLEVERLVLGPVGKGLAELLERDLTVDGERRRRHVPAPSARR